MRNKYIFGHSRQTKSRTCENAFVSEEFKYKPVIPRHLKKIYIGLFTKPYKRYSEI